MIHEIATITIELDKARLFEEAVAAARPYFEAAKGFVSFTLQRSIENPECYRLVIGWDSVEAHIVDFRKSDSFNQWRSLASPFFVIPPSVEHMATVL